MTDEPTYQRWTHQKVNNYLLFNEPVPQAIMQCNQFTIRNQREPKLLDLVFEQDCDE